MKSRATTGHVRIFEFFFRHRFGRKSSVVSCNIITAHSLREAGEDVRNRESRVLNCGLSSQEIGIGNNPLISWDGFDGFAHRLTVLRSNSG